MLVKYVKTRSISMIKSSIQFIWAFLTYDVSKIPFIGRWLDLNYHVFMVRIGKDQLPERCDSESDLFLGLFGFGLLELIWCTALVLYIATNTQDFHLAMYPYYFLVVRVVVILTPYLIFKAFRKTSKTVDLIQEDFAVFRHEQKLKREQKGELTSISCDDSKGRLSEAKRET